jgi:hypothetical protein
MNVSEMSTTSFIDLMVETVRTPEMSVYFNENIRRYKPERCFLLFSLRLFPGVFVVTMSAV